MPRFARLAYYSTSSPFCQGVLQKFFQLFSRLFRAALNFGGNARLLYHISFHLSRGFPKVFSTFFSWYFVSPSFAVSRSLTACCLVDSLHIIALHPPFVKWFLQSFCGLGALAVWHNSKRNHLCTLNNESFFLHGFPLTSRLEYGIIQKNGNFLYPAATILSVFSSI